MWKQNFTTCVKTEFHDTKSVRIRSFSGPYFHAFGLNMEIFSVNFRIQSKCEKIRTRKIPSASTIYAVSSVRRSHRDFFFIYISLHKNWSFPLRVSLVIVTTSTVSSIFSHIHWRNPWWKTSFFVECLHNYIMSLRCGPKHQFCRILLNRCSRVLFSLLSYCF